MKINDAYKQYLETGDKDSLILACYDYALAIACTRLKIFFSVKIYEKEDLAGECIPRILMCIKLFDNNREEATFLTYVGQAIRRRIDYLIHKEYNRKQFWSIQDFDYEYLPIVLNTSMREELIDHIADAMLQLSKKDQYLLKEYYYKGKKLRELGKIFKISYERVRQLKLDALYRLLGILLDANRTA